MSLVLQKVSAFLLFLAPFHSRESLPGNQGNLGASRAEMGRQKDRDLMSVFQHLKPIMPAALDILVTGTNLLFFSWL